MKKLLLIGITFGAALAAHGDTRDEIRTKVSNHLEAVLRSKSDNGDLVKRRVGELTLPFSKLPETVEPSVARWIMDSTVALVSNRTDALLKNDEQSQQLVRSFVVQAEKRFTSLGSVTPDSAAGPKKATQEFFRDFRAAFIEHVSKIPQINLSIDSPERMSEVQAEASKANPTKTSKGGVEQISVLGFAGTKVAEAFAHHCSELIRGSENSANFSFGNFFSKAFDRADAMPEMKSFAEVRGNVTNNLSAIITPTNVQSVQLECLLRQISSFQMSAVICTNRKSEPVMVIQFKNSPDVWQSLRHMH